MMEQAILSKSNACTPNRYDGDINGLVDYVNVQFKQNVARKGGFLVKKLRGDDEILDCVSIDNIAGLPKAFCADLIPKTSNGDYFLDLILYTNKVVMDKFTPITRGDGRAKVDFQDEITSAVYGVFMEEPGMQDLTLMPIKPNSGSEAFSEHLGRVHKRLWENKNNIYLYCTSNIDDKSAFVVHIPQDPYRAVSLVKKWLESIQNLSKK